MAKERILTAENYIRLDKERKARRKSESTEPEVGIWWDNGRKLVVISDPLSVGERAARWVNGAWDHWRAWPAVAGGYGCTAEDEYCSVPRGRVVFDLKVEAAVIYHGSQTNVRRLDYIAKAFRLTRWTAQLDLHYEKHLPEFEWEND